VQMRDGFSAIASIIDDQPVAAFLESFLRGDFSRLEQQMAQHRMIVWSGFGDSRDGLLGDNQNVRGCLRADIAEGQHEVVFVNDLRGNLSRDDLFKESHAERSRSPHHKRTVRTGILHGQAGAQELNNLIVE
jgi:hypothetical protein